MVDCNWRGTSGLTAICLQEIDRFPAMKKERGRAVVRRRLGLCKKRKRRDQQKSMHMKLRFRALSVLLHVSNIADCDCGLKTDDAEETSPGELSMIETGSWHKKFYAECENSFKMLPDAACRLVVRRETLYFPMVRRM